MNYIISILLMLCGACSCSSSKTIVEPIIEPTRTPIEMTSYWELTNYNRTEYFSETSLRIEKDSFILKNVGIGIHTNLPTTAFFIGQVLEVEGNIILNATSFLTITEENTISEIVNKDIPLYRTYSPFEIYIDIDGNVGNFINIVPNSYYK
tara:strand:- start:2973 stop:3425 length:453 start_codon:yes stop_codon:yes gene_type:complete